MAQVTFDEKTGVSIPTTREVRDDLAEAVQDAMPTAANGDPASLESFQAPQMSLFKGQLTAIVQTEETPGVIVFEASAPGVKSSKIELISE